MLKESHIVVGLTTLKCLSTCNWTGPIRTFWVLASWMMDDFLNFFLPMIDVSSWSIASLCIMFCVLYLWTVLTQKHIMLHKVICAFFFTLKLRGFSSTWIHVDSCGFMWVHVDSCGFMWILSKIQNTFFSCGLYGLYGLYAPCGAMCSRVRHWVLCLSVWAFSCK